MNLRSSPMAVPGLRSRLLALLVLSTGCVDGAQEPIATFLITDPVERFEIVVDRGSIQAVSYDRTTVMYKRHAFGYVSSLGEQDYSLEDGVVRFEAHCSGRRNECTWDHMLEMPYGVGFDVSMTEALIDLANIDGDIAMTFEIGNFKGTRLKSRNVAITAEAATVVLEFDAAPETVTLGLQEADVSLTVPTGSYRCVFAGDVATSGITCDETAASTLSIDVGAGDVTVTGKTAP